MAGGNDEFMQQLMKMMGIGAGVGSAGAGAWGLMHPGKNPSEGAINTLNGIPGKVNPYYKPYQDAGGRALGSLEDQNKGLLGGTTQNDLGKNYKESPGYQFALQQAMQAGNNASASGGMLGTPQHAEQNMGVAQGLAAKDYNDYMDRQTNLYNTGYKGTEGLNEQGYNANKDMGQIVGDTENLKAGYQYAGDAGKNEHNKAMWEQILGGIGTAGGAYFGGPVGGTAGGTAANSFSDFIKHLFGGGK